MSPKASLPSGRARVRPLSIHLSPKVSLPSGRARALHWFFASPGPVSPPGCVWSPQLVSASCCCSTVCTLWVCPIACLRVLLPTPIATPCISCRARRVSVRINIFIPTAHSYLQFESIVFLLLFLFYFCTATTIFCGALVVSSRRLLSSTCRIMIVPPLATHRTLVDANVFACIPFWCTYRVCN